MYRKANFRSDGVEPDHKLGSKEGMSKSLLTVIENERRQPLELFKNYKTSREIVWLSPFCSTCKYFKAHGSRLRCEYNEAKLIKPFFGKVEWTVLINSDGTEEQIPTNIDWDVKRIDVDDLLIERAMANINLGKPYPCFRI